MVFIGRLRKNRVRHGAYKEPILTVLGEVGVEFRDELAVPFGFNDRVLDVDDDVMRFVAGQSLHRLRGGKPGFARARPRDSWQKHPHSP
jgi:hypothetical protein